MERVVEVVIAGVSSLATYLAGHVILCLLPALLIAGGVSALVPKEAVTRFLGAKSRPVVAYPIAAVGGFILAVCSCTILPLFSSIYRRGAGLGPAMTFLFVGPAINILAVSLTSVQLGVDFAVARLVLSITFGITIGVAMNALFKDAVAVEADPKKKDPFAQRGSLDARGLVVVGLSLALLLAGTLPVPPLSTRLFSVGLPGPLQALQASLAALVPEDPALGIEGLTVPGVFLIGLLVVLGLVVWRQLAPMEPTARHVTVVFAALAVTLAFATVGFDRAAGAVVVTGRLPVVLVVMAGLVGAARRIDVEERVRWLQEAWRFTRQIVPLLLVGVTVAGALRVVIPAEAVRAVAGDNTLLANLAATLTGVVLYFPTLVEVPVAHTLLSLGMHRGPLLAYLMADPELSVQSLLVTGRVIGAKKAAAYAGLVVVFATTAGMIFGALQG